MGNLAVVEKLDRLLQAICQSLVDRDFRYRAESHCSIFAILLGRIRSEEHTSELQSLMRISYAVFCLKKKKYYITVLTSKYTHTDQKYTQLTQQSLYR